MLEVTDKNRGFMTNPPKPKTNLLKTIGICLIIFMAVLLFLKDIVIKTVAVNQASAILGAQVHMGSFSWNLFTQNIVVRDLKIDHPAGYEKGNFVNIPQVTVKYDMGQLLKGKVHLPLVLVDLKEMTAIRNKEGKFNVDALKVMHPDKKEKMVIPPFQIDELRLNVGQVIYRDYYKRESVNILVYDVDIKNKTFKDINTVPKLVGVVLAQALKQTAIQGVGLYAAEALMGVGFLPGAVIGVIVAKDNEKKELAAGFAKVFDTSVAFVKEKGQLKNADRNTGIIMGLIDKADVTIKLEKTSWSKTTVTVTARKYFMAQKEFAAGILYQIGQRL